MFEGLMERDSRASRRPHFLKMRVALQGICIPAPILEKHNLDSRGCCKEEHQNTSLRAAACSKMMTLWPALLIPIAAASPLTPHPMIATVHIGRVIYDIVQGRILPSTKNK